MIALLRRRLAGLLPVGLALALGLALVASVVGHGRKCLVVGGKICGGETVVVERSPRCGGEDEGFMQLGQPGRPPWYLAVPLARRSQHAPRVHAGSGT